jgi:hypothetical protein
MKKRINILYKVKDLNFKPLYPCFYTIKNKAIAQCVIAFLVFSRIDVGTVTDCKSATSGILNPVQKKFQKYFWMVF